MDITAASKGAIAMAQIHLILSVKALNQIQIAVPVYIT